MRSHRLPTIEKPNPEKEHSPENRWSYYKAMSELKDISQKVSVVKNRLNFLITKQQQADSPHARLQEEKLMRLRTEAHQGQHRLREELSLKKLKSQSEVELKRRSNQLYRRETVERIDRARKELMGDKLRAHESVRQQSRLNLQAIDSFRHSFLAEKQTRRQLLYAQERQQRQHLKQISEMKIKEVQAQWANETQRINQKIERKRKQLNQIQEECEEFQQLQAERMARHRQRKQQKMQKLKRRKLITIQTRSTDNGNLHKQSSQSTSPHSWASFVVIS